MNVVDIEYERDQWAAFNEHEAAPSNDEPSDRAYVHVGDTVDVDDDASECHIYWSDENQQVGFYWPVTTLKSSDWIADRTGTTSDEALME